MAYSARWKRTHGGFRVWRLTRTGDTSKAFDGRGAQQHGGRWNRVGTRAIYTAQSLSLCALEILVHVDPEDMPDDYCYFEAEIPREVQVEQLSQETLPKGWRRHPPPVETQDLGASWIEREAASVLSVPSAVIPLERVFVINPAHPDFDKIRLSSPMPFRFDERLKKA